MYIGITDIGKGNSFKKFCDVNAHDNILDQKYEMIFHWKLKV